MTSIVHRPDEGRREEEREREREREREGKREREREREREGEGGTGGRKRERETIIIQIIIIYEDQYSKITSQLHTQFGVDIISTYQTAVSNMQSRECVVKILV